MTVSVPNKRSLPARGSCNGFILVPVLWVLAFLALVSAILTRTVSNDLKAASNALHQADAELLSDGIARLTVRYVVAKGISANQSGAFKLSGEPLSCRVGDSVASISVVLAAGLIDVNTASQDVLEALFTELGAASPSGLAAALIDFRDPDSEAIPQGAEATDYTAAGLPYGPKNANLDVVGEIDQIIGITPEIVERALPLLTTQSHQTAPDTSVGVPQIASLRLKSSFWGTYKAKPLRIIVSVAAPNRPHSYARQASILLQPRVQNGYILKDWSRIEQSMTAASDADLPSCVASLLSLG